MSRTRGRQLVAYANKVYGVGGELAKIPDGRRDPEIPHSLINSTLLVSGLLRVRSAAQALSGEPACNSRARASHTGALG
jgi:hypothetical protein